MMDFLNNNQGALMVVITVIYVLATILIWIANKKSADSTKEQIDLSKRQYEESKRLEVMPYLQFTVEKLPATDNPTPCLFIILYENKTSVTKSIAYITLKNIGSGIAHHTRITVTTRYKEYDEYPAKDIVISPQSEKHTFVEFYAEIPKASTGCREDITARIEYEDILGNAYYQEANFLFVASAENSSFLNLIDMNSPQLKSKL